MTNFGSATPVLRCFDEAKTKEFYFDFLGFELDFEHRFDPSAPLYMGIRKGGCTIHLSEHFEDGVPGSAVRIQVDDVSAYMAELRGKHYRHANPGEPELMEWGNREITIGDPAGNRICFYTEGGDGPA